MGRLIDADLLLENYNLKNADKRNPEGCDTLMKYEVADMIEDAPTVDAVPVVRCKDCEHWGMGVAGETERVKCCEYGRYMVGENGYCVYGEERK